MRELIVYKRHLKTGVFFYSRFMNQKTKKYDTSFCWVMKRVKE